METSSIDVQGTCPACPHRVGDPELLRNHCHSSASRASDDRLTGSLQFTHNETQGSTSPSNSGPDFTADSVYTLPIHTSEKASTTGSTDLNKDELSYCPVSVDSIMEGKAHPYRADDQASINSKAREVDEAADDAGSEASSSPTTDEDHESDAEGLDLERSQISLDDAPVIETIRLPSCCGDTVGHLTVCSDCVISSDHECSNRNQDLKQGGVQSEDESLSETFGIDRCACCTQSSLKPRLTSDTESSDDEDSDDSDDSTDSSIMNIATYPSVEMRYILAHLKSCSRCWKVFGNSSSTSAIVEQQQACTSSEVAQEDTEHAKSGPQKSLDVEYDLDRHEVFLMKYEDQFYAQTFGTGNEDTKICAYQLAGEHLRTCDGCPIDVTAPVEACDWTEEIDSDGECKSISLSRSKGESNRTNRRLSFTPFDGFPDHKCECIECGRQTIYIANRPSESHYSDSNIPEVVRPVPSILSKKVQQVFADFIRLSNMYGPSSGRDEGFVDSYPAASSIESSFSVLEMQRPDQKSEGAQGSRRGTANSDAAHVEDMEHGVDGDEDKGAKEVIVTPRQAHELHIE